MSLGRFVLDEPDEDAGVPPPRNFYEQQQMQQQAARPVFAMKVVPLASSFVIICLIRGLFSRPLESSVVLPPCSNSWLPRELRLFELQRRFPAFPELCEPAPCERLRRRRRPLLFWNTLDAA